MGVRIAHHYAMYFILAWVMFHIYYQVWRTIFWKEGDIAVYVKNQSDMALVREFLKSIRSMDHHDFEYVMEILR